MIRVLDGEVVDVGGGCVVRFAADFVLIWSESGESDRDARRAARDIVEMLRQSGIAARVGHSPYVDHAGVEVERGKEKQAERLIGRWHGR